LAKYPPKSNRNKPICFNAYLYRAGNLVEQFFDRISSAVGSPRGTTKLIEQLTRAETINVQ
jgi:hypothetical protein